MKAFKKYISLLLVVLMIFTSFPMTSFAVTTSNNTNEILAEEAENDALVTWNYDEETDTLYINGNIIFIGDYGALPIDVKSGFTFSHLVFGKDVTEIAMRWRATKSTRNYPYRKAFDITFEEGSVIKTIGAYAFMGSYVKSITFPDSLECIRSYAFANCSKLESIKLGSSLKSIYGNAFYKAPLTELELNDGLESIEKEAFKGASISSLTLPDSLYYIGYDAFYGNSIKELNFAENAEELYIGENAFWGNLLTKITIPWYVTNLGNCCFAATKLREATFETRETEEGLRGVRTVNNPFSDSQITSLVIPETAVNVGPFSGMRSLEYIDISKVNPDGLNNNLFRNDVSLTEVLLPDNMTTLPQACFFGCTSLENVDLPQTITKFENSCFYNCTALNNLDLPSGLDYVGDECFVACKAFTDVHFKHSLNYLGKSAFSNCTALESINLPLNCDTIGLWTFASCSSLDNVVIPDCVTTLGQGAFLKCTSLSNLKLPRNLECIGNECFSNSYKLDITIPETVTEIGANAFTHSGITNAYIKKNCNLASSAFSEANRLKTVVFENEWNSALNSRVFKSCASLETVTLPRDITSIGFEAFRDCTELKTVNIPNDALITEYGESAFHGCEKLVSFNITSKVEKIGTSAFSHCTSLKNVDLGNTKVKTIADFAFAYTAIESVRIPENINLLDNAAFSGSSLKSIEYPESMANNFGHKNSLNNTPLEVITVKNRNASFKNIPPQFLDNNVTVRGYLYSTAQAFAQQNGLQFVALDANEYDVPNTAKQGTFDNGTWCVTSDGKLYINGNGELKVSGMVDSQGISFTIPKLISFSNINTIIIGGGITTIPDNFINDSQYSVASVTSVILPDTLESIGEYAFANSNINSINLPDSLTTISKGAFVNCQNLKELTIKSNVTSIGYQKNTGMPFGFDNSGNPIDGFVLNCDINSTAYAHAYNNDINCNVIMPEGDNIVTGYFSSPDCASWYYYPETKEFYYIPSKAEPTVNQYYLSNGRALSAGELDVDTLHICYKIGTLKGIDGKSIFADINPENLDFSNANTVYLFEYALSGLTNIKSFDIPESVSRIDATAFSSFPAEYISFVGKITRIPDGAFKGNKTLRYIDLNGIKEIGVSAFESCTALEEIVIPKSVEKIKESAFARCFNTKSLRIEDDGPDGPKGIYIFPRAFADLALCDTVVFDRFWVHYWGHIDGKLCYDIEKDYPQEVSSIMKGLGSATTGVSLSVRASDDCFYMFDNVNIVELNLGKDAYFRGYENAYMPNLKTITVDEENEWLSVYDGCLYNNYNHYEVEDGIEEPRYELLLVPATKKSVDIKADTDYIYERAFRGSLVEEVTIPDGCRLADVELFLNCTQLRTVTLPASITDICQGAFENCTKLKVITIPSANAIWNDAFKNCKKLSSVILPSNLETIGVSTFAECSSLIGMVVPESCDEIQSKAFENCTSLTDIYLWDTHFGLDTFKGCENLTIHTMAGSKAYACAKLYGLEVEAFTDEDLFADTCAMKEDIYEGYLGFCDDGHGDIQYLTVYEPSCTQDGYIIGVCEYCSVILTEEHIVAEGHNYINTVSIPATETTQGVEKYECTNCKDVLTSFTPATTDNAEKTMCHITGQAVIANDVTGEKGTTPLGGVAIKMNGETLDTTDASGSYSFNLETGLYELVLHYDYGFDRTVYLVVRDEDVDMGKIPLIACDWNKDGVINDDDYVLFRYVIGSKSNSPSYLIFVDMNNDGKIDVKDLIYMNNVKGIDSDSFVYPCVVIGA